MTRHYPVHDALLLPPQARVALEGAKTALSKQLADAQRLCAAAGEECARVRKRNEQARTNPNPNPNPNQCTALARCMHGACMVHQRCTHMHMHMHMHMLHVWQLGRWSGSSRRRRSGARPPVWTR